MEQRLHTRLAHFADSMRAIAHDPDACTCEARSWHGKGHDSACPITVAKNALKRQGLRHVAPMYPLNDREHATVLAALRLYQAEGMPTHGEPASDIATNGGNVKPLDANDIDALCERLNCGG
jgi:hypothetical protein